MKKILIIEDDESIRRNVVELLSVESFQVISAENGKIGLQRAKEILPDLIICDVNMPELDGYGVVKNLRKDPRTTLVPFIFLTGRSGRDDLRQGMNLGADDYLTKPFTRQELLTAIDSRMARHSAVVSVYQEELKQAQNQIRHVALHDVTTGLPGWSVFQERLNSALARAGRNKMAALLQIGLDRFEKIDRLGPEKAGVVLKLIADRLLECLRKDKCVIGKIGADQFLVFLTSIKRKKDAVDIAELIRRRFAEPLVLTDLELYLTVSVGIAAFPQDARGGDSLQSKAGSALRHAKKSGGNQCQCFHPEFTSATLDRLSLEAELYRALAHKQFELNYQPQVHLRTGEVMGAEVLLRWRHPQLGQVSPDEFIPLAEESGLISEIGCWVLKTAAAQAVKWKEEGLPPVRLAVNVSGREFMQDRISERFAQTIERSGLDPSFLEVELTESILMRNVEKAIETMKRLRDMGVRISIDDFGVGYSSLSYLKRFPFDTLKVDRSFIRSISQDSKDSVITKTLIHMAHALHLTVIAEGVETAEELDFLREQDCDCMQGYYFSRPVSASDFGKLLGSQRNLYDHQHFSQGDLQCTPPK